MPQILSFPNLQVVSINDFTPGVIQSGKNTAIYSSTAPLGSASQAFRCYAIAESGLCPFPTYSPFGSVTANSSFFVTTAAMRSVGMLMTGTVGPPFNEVLLMSTLSSLGSGMRFDIYNFASLSTTNYSAASSLYTSTTATPISWAAFWPNMDTQVLNPGNVPRRVVVTIDPLQTAAPVRWVTVPAATGAGASATGTFTAQAGSSLTALVFSSTSRVCFIPFGIDSTGFGGFVNYQNAYEFYTSDQQAMTNITGPQYFFPEIGNRIGSWGTISAGELFLLYSGGGAVILTGDPQFPTSALKLPGVVGTGNAVGAGCQCAAGLVYLTDFDGAYVWNGGNTSQKMSPQLTDNSALTRIHTGIFANQPQALATTHHDAWDNWVLFANNWTLDIMTGAWWQIEDPGVVNFQVHTRSMVSPQFFYSSDGYAAVTLANNKVSIYQWDASKPASSYSWTSNPIAQPGADLTLEAVEICASNPTATTATITVTATAPPNQSTYPGNQNPSQSQTYTIPPTTAGFRQALPFGYLDYNCVVKITAANSSSSNQAPVLHEINLGYTPRNS